MSKIVLGLLYPHGDVAITSIGLKLVVCSRYAFFF